MNQKQLFRSLARKTGTSKRERQDDMGELNEA